LNFSHLRLSARSQGQEGGQTKWFPPCMTGCPRSWRKIIIYGGLIPGNLRRVSVRNADEAARMETGNFRRGDFFERLFLPALVNAARKFAYAQCSTDLARTAIALERYRLAHGEFPESLDALASQFIQKIPHDIINGQPL